MTYFESIDVRGNKEYKSGKNITDPLVLNMTRLHFLPYLGSNGTGSSLRGKFKIVPVHVMPIVVHMCSQNCTTIVINSKEEKMHFDPLSLTLWTHEIRSIPV